MHPCSYCLQTVPITRLNSISSSRFICGDCWINYQVKCRQCNRYFLEEDTTIDYRYSRAGSIGWFCNNCHARGNLRLEHRPYTSIVVGSGKGDIVDSARGWSTELECYTTDQPKLAEEFSKLPTTFGINRDGSLRSVGESTSDGKSLAEGIEITTPVLKGVAGEKYLKDLCAALNKDDNTRVNLTCGTHIHLDMSDLRGDFATVQRLLVFHWVYETVLMSFLPSTRRANEYCQSLKNSYSIKRILATKDYDELYTLWYKNRNISSRYNKKHTRYHGINMHSLFADGHVEIRYHSGTTNPKKILHWVALHTRIIDACGGLTNKAIDVHTLAGNALTTLGRSRTLSILTTQFFEWLNLKEDTREYFLSRQKKFKDMPESREVEFIEKDDPRIYEGTVPEKKDKFSYATSMPFTFTPAINQIREVLEEAHSFEAELSDITEDQL